MNQPNRQIDFRRMSNFMENVPGVHPQVKEFLYPGPDFPLIRELPNLDVTDPAAFKIFEGPEAVSVLKEFIDHWILGKFLGPYPPWVRTLYGKPIKWVPMFTIPKADSTPSNPKNRVLLNAAYKHPDPWSVEDWNYIMNFNFNDAGDAEWATFKNTLLIRTLNECLEDRKVEFNSIKDIIKGLYRVKLL